MELGQRSQADEPAAAASERLPFLHAVAPAARRPRVRDAVPLEGSADASEWHDGLHNSDVVFAASPPPPLELLPQRGSISGGVAQGVSVGAATALLVASLFLALRSVRRRIKERREAALELTRAA